MTPPADIGERGAVGKRGSQPPSNFWLYDDWVLAQAADVTARERLCLTELPHSLSLHKALFREVAPIPVPTATSVPGPHSEPALTKASLLTRLLATGSSPGR